MAKERTASQLFWAIKSGIKFTGMPSFGLAGTSDQDIWSVVAFVKKSPCIRRRVQGLDGVPLGAAQLPQQLFEMRDERRVRRRHRVGSQVLRPRPFQRLIV